MIKKKVTIEETVEFLDELARLDPQAMSALINHRVPCTKEMGDHPTVQCADRQLALGESVKYPCEVGILGILNGIFGADSESWGAICAQMEGATVKGFALLGDRMKEV